MSDWKNSRLGKFTASEIGKLMVKGRGKDEYFGEGAITYIESRAAEIFNQQPIADLEGMSAIEWGNQYELEAAQAAGYGRVVGFDYHGKETPKFFAYEAFPLWAGGSPDGLIHPTKTVVELKCPSTATHHIKYWRMKTAADLKSVKPLYYGQIQFNMMCSKYDNGLFASYDPRANENGVKLKKLDVPYDKLYCEELHERLERAIALLRQIVFDDILGSIAAKEAVFVP